MRHNGARLNITQETGSCYQIKRTNTELVIAKAALVAELKEVEEEEEVVVVVVVVRL